MLSSTTFTSKEIAMQETWVQSLGWEDPLEKGTVTHSSSLAWRIPWTIQSMGGHKELDTTDHESIIFILFFFSEWT